MEYINHEGNLLPINEPILSYNNRSFRYGDGLFETIRLINGEIPFLNAHISRLSEGMDILKMIIPTDFSENFFKEKIIELAKKNEIFPNARIRLTIYRKGGGLYTPSINDCAYIIEAKPIQSNKYELNAIGLNIGIYYDMTKSSDKTNLFKINNRAINILASIYKEEQGLDDCLLLNSHNRITESISSNIFIYKEGKLQTPLLSESCVKGVMRSRIMEISKSESILVEEIRMEEQDLLNADEIFLTNAIQGIKWVASINEKSYKNELSSKWIKLLISDNN